MCPECSSRDIRIDPYDFGICRETGYHDAGERYRCRTCSATGDVEDAAHALATLTGENNETDHN